MKSQRFSISKFLSRKSKPPFRKSKVTAQEQDSLTEEDQDYLTEEEETSILEEEKQPTQEEQLASVILDEEAGSDGEECELHVYEQRFDTRGERVVLRAGTKSELLPPKRKSHRACLVLTRHYSLSQRLSYTVLEIQSRHIIKALREVIGTYLGVDFTSEPIVIQEPPRCLFHYRDELRRYAEKSDNQQLKSHLQLCLQYMEKTLHQEIKIFQSSVSKVSSSPELDHRHLWMVFKPGCLVYEKRDGIEGLSRLRSMDEEEEDDSFELREWRLHTERVGFVGSAVGLMHHSLEIDRYEGRKPVCELKAVPLHLHPENKRIRHDLLERGRKFISLCGIHHCFYDGVGHMYDRTSPKGNETSHTNVCVSTCGCTKVCLN
jgi:hypothetical protein